ncbi:hypothetical protein RvY_02944 [Ramazzottius varieornatus]|uniref:RING-type domain-containing protein n=1 Tax=Ramazzottius varieornatus TaxID=947166 RepID=A0A1D1UM77_RAMVA|nr:hypothetical protein RvY_02944 [Ramazzottius varieornatus]
MGRRYCVDCHKAFDKAALLSDGSCPECFSKNTVKVRPVKPTDSTLATPKTAVSPSLPTALNVSPATGVLTDQFPVPIPENPIAPIPQSPIRRPAILPHSTHNDTISQNTQPIIPTLLQTQRFSHPPPPLLPYTIPQPQPFFTANYYNAGITMSNQQMTHPQILSQAMKSLREDQIPMVQLLATVDMMEKFVQCAEVAMLMEQAPILQSVIQRLQSVKVQFHSKTKEFLEKQLSLQNAMLESNCAVTAPEKPLVVEPQRWRPKALSNTLFVKKLPPGMVEEDLYKHFLQFCGQPSGIIEINVARDENKQSRGHAYVVLRNELSVTRALAQKSHFVKGVFVAVSLFDAEKQQRRRRAYKLFISRLSSHLSHENLKLLLEGTYGKLDDLWYCPSKEQARSNNAHACASFQNPETNNEILAAGIIKIGSESYVCNPYTQQKSPTERKAKADTSEDPDISVRSATGTRSPTADLCRMCISRTSCILLTPCNHLGLCGYCAGPLKECPFCRTAIESKEKVFVPQKDELIRLTRIQKFLDDWHRGYCSKGSST